MECASGLPDLLTLANQLEAAAAGRLDVPCEHCRAVGTDAAKPCGSKPLDLISSPTAVLLATGPTMRGVTGAEMEHMPFYLRTFL